MSKNIFETGSCACALSRAFTHNITLPCPTDTPLFSCQCSKGKEREVICDVMAKCVPSLSLSLISFV